MHASARRALAASALGTLAALPLEMAIFRRAATSSSGYLHATVFALTLLASREALGWAGREHRAIGTEAYIAACERLADRANRDEQTAQRYSVACSNLQVTALLYGQGSAVSGDWVSEPNELVSATGAIRALKRTNYYRLALTNSAHFHPLATREWRDFHSLAIATALAASRMQGAEQIQGFEQAFTESAFGDHFLQDCFAAGHMGFNRPASSAGASKVFHDEWNARGRRVTNRRGETWFTNGDGRLDTPANRDARRRVIAATTSSVYAVLVAFIFGERDPAADFAVWQEVPYTIDDQELLPAVEALFGGSETLARPGALPLLAVKRPASKDGVLGAWSSFALAFGHDDHAIGSLVFGGDLLIPRIGVRAEVGGGIAFEDELDAVRFAVDAGVVRRFGLSFDGLISHEVDVGALVTIGSDVDAVVRASYRVNIEAAEWLLRPEIGPAVDIASQEAGLYVGFGILKVLNAAGGGGFY